MGKKGQKGCKIQRIRKFVVRLYFLVTPEAIAIKSHLRDRSNVFLNKEDTSEHAKLDREEHTDWFQCQNTHTSNIVQTQQVIFRNIYV